MLCPDPPPDPTASATLSSDRHCRGDNVEVSSSQRLDVVVVPTSVESYGALWTPGERWGSGLTKERTDGILIGCGRHPGNGRASKKSPGRAGAFQGDMRRHLGIKVP